MRFWAGLLGVKMPELSAGEKANKAPGEYCKGKFIDECKTLFGNALETVCATCPD